MTATCDQPISTRRVIRPATVADIPAMLAMAERFAATPEYRAWLPLDRDRLDALIRQLIANDRALVLIAEDDGPVGMLGLLLCEHPWTGETLATELVWWVDPACRGCGYRLLIQAEQWARDHGATVIQMIAPTPRVGEFYERLGYAPVETSYQKRL